jgi:hypothetical protein
MSGTTMSYHQTSSHVAVAFVVVAQHERRKGEVEKGIFSGNIVFVEIDLLKSFEVHNYGVD